jgi:hypothetical protein
MVDSRALHFLQGWVRRGFDKTSAAGRVGHQRSARQIARLLLKGLICTRS